MLLTRELHTSTSGSVECLMIPSLPPGHNPAVLCRQLSALHASASVTVTGAELHMQ